MAAAADERSGAAGTTWWHRAHEEAWAFRQGHATDRELWATRGELYGSPPPDTLKGSGAVVGVPVPLPPPRADELWAWDPELSLSPRPDPLVTMSRAFLSHAAPQAADDSASDDDDEEDEASVDHLLDRGRRVLQQSSAEVLTFRRITRMLKEASRPEAALIDVVALRELFARRLKLDISPRQAQRILDRAAAPDGIKATDLARLALLLVEAATDDDDDKASSFAVAPNKKLLYDAHLRCTLAGRRLATHMMTDPPPPSRPPPPPEPLTQANAPRAAPREPPTEVQLAREQLARRQWAENLALRDSVRRVSQNTSPCLALAMSG